MAHLTVRRPRFIGYPGIGMKDQGPERQPVSEGPGYADPAPLFASVYEELKQRAAARLDRERAGHTLQPTALVHEAWLKLRGQAEFRAQDPDHVLALASMAMRRILVDHARTRGRLRRGGGARREELATSLAAPDSKGTVDLEALGDALDRLEEKSPRLARLVELRFFGGLAREDAARVLRVSRATVARDWRAAKAFLSNHLARCEEDPDGKG